MVGVEPGTIVYRAEIFGESIFYSVAVVGKITAKGFWVEPPRPNICERNSEVDVVSAIGKIDLDVPRRWYSFNTYKWSTTKEEALGHLVARKRSYVKHSRRRLQQAERAARIAASAWSKLKDGHPIDAEEEMVTITPDWPDWP
jgi:hypothetical protein